MKRTREQIEAEIDAFERKHSGQFIPSVAMDKYDRLLVELAELAEAECANA